MTTTKGEQLFEGVVEEGIPDAEARELDAEAEDSVVQITPAGLASLTTTPVFAADEVSIPRLRLAQGLTQEVQDGNARPGQWVLTGFEPTTEVHFFPQVMGRFRALRNAETRTLLCVSHDGVHGVGAPGGACQTCPLSQWTENPKGGKNLPPACTFGYRYVGWVKEYDTMAALELKGSGINAGKYINTCIQARALGNFGLKLSSKSMQGPRGTYHVVLATMFNAQREDLELARSFLRGG
jgi:hypothetical protein